jgi:iron complex transport system ATP-binding protein
MPSPRRKRPDTPVLIARDLSVETLNDRIILQDLNWTVNAGEHWVILGANGSGKTSLLNILLGYLTPTTGGVTFGHENPEDWETWDAAKRRIGFVSASVGHQIEWDEPASDVVLSGRYAMINYWARRTPKSDRADAAKILRQIEAEHLADQPWSFLSQGERQRMLFGRALMARDLALLILDEPCAGLDPVARENFLGFLQRFGSKKNAPPLVLVTHHVEEISPFFTHALILKEGRPLAAGPIIQTLTSGNLSEAFDAPVTLSRRKRSGLEHPPYTLTLKRNSKSVF